MKSSAANSNGTTKKLQRNGSAPATQPAQGATQVTQAAGTAVGAQTSTSMPQPTPARPAPPLTISPSSDASTPAGRAAAGAPVIQVPGAPASVAAPPSNVVPILEQLQVDGPQLDQVGLEPFRHDRVYLGLKRALDVAAAGFALALLAPVFLAIALLIKLEDRGPVFFFQTRVGKNGRHFRFWKFRSMIVDAEQRKAELRARASGEAVSDRLRFKMQDDPRVTRVGRVLRRFSLDELPQLWNVLQGDMTLVGPRPPIPEEVAEYSPRHMRRLEVEQGITCLWQVSGRNLLSFEQQVELDIEYARRRDLALDLSLLFRTIPAVLSGRGAC